MIMKTHPDGRSWEIEAEYDITWNEKRLEDMSKGGTEVLLQHTAVSIGHQG